MLRFPRLKAPEDLDAPRTALVGPALKALRKGRVDLEKLEQFKKYQTAPQDYTREVLGLTPWAGCNLKKGQLELYLDIADSVRRQLAGDTTAPRIFRVEAGHGVGKTYGCAGLVNWFFDCFNPAIILTTAPSSKQVEKLLWKDIKKLRPKDAPGRVLPSAPYMERAPDHFALGTATNNNNGKGTENFQGQHGEHLMFVLDEAEGVSDFVFDAVNAMMTGGRVLICVMIANPRTRTSRFFRTQSRPGVLNYRLSVLDHPNVVEGRPVIPGATDRRWVNEMIGEHCKVVTTHSEDDFTFSVTWDVPGKENQVYAAGTIFQPDNEFLFRVMGIPPLNSADNTLIPVGRYEAALKRAAPTPAPNPTEAWMGVDVARFGSDAGTIYVRHKGVIRRVARILGQDSNHYLAAIRENARKLKALGVVKLHLRVDGGGGYGSGVIDPLKGDLEMLNLFREWKVFEVHNNGTPRDESAFADVITELYWHAGETLKGVRVEDAPNELLEDLCDRQYDYANRAGVTVKVLESKAAFKKPKRAGRSPDDGDGFVLCSAPDFLFAPKTEGKVYDWGI